MKLIKKFCLCCLLGHDSSDDKSQAVFVRQPVMELQGHSNVVIAADWMPSGNQVMTASWDRTANLYDVETGAILNSFPGYPTSLKYNFIHKNNI